MLLSLRRLQADPSTDAGWKVRSWKPSGRFLFAFAWPARTTSTTKASACSAWSATSLRTVAGQRAVRAGAGAGAAAAWTAARTRPNLLLGTFNRGLFRYDGAVVPRRSGPTATRTCGADALQGHRAARTAPSACRRSAAALVIIDPRTGHALHYINQATGPARPTTAWPMFGDRTGIRVAGAPKGRSARSKRPRRSRGSTSTSGLSGSVSDVVRHKGVLYVATGVGVFYLDPSSSTVQAGHRLSRGQLPGDGLASNGDVLMVGYGSGLHQIDGAVAHGSSSPTSGHRSRPAPSGSRGRTRSRLVDRARRRPCHRCASDDAGRWIDEGRVPGMRETLQHHRRARPRRALARHGAQGVLRVRFNGASLDSPDRSLRQGTGAGRRQRRRRVPGGRRPGVRGEAGRLSVRRVHASALRRTTAWQGLSVGGTQDQSANVAKIAWATCGRTSAVKPACSGAQSDGSYRLDKTALLRFPTGGGQNLRRARRRGLVRPRRRADPVRSRRSAKNYTTPLLRAHPSRHASTTDGCSSAAPPRTATAPMLHSAPRAGDNALRFEFASTSSTSSRETHYQTMLEGFDCELVALDDRVEARLHQPAPGDVPLPCEGAEPLSDTRAPKPTTPS